MNNSFLGKAFRLIGATLLAQLILISSTPILTRLYSPETFGIFAILFGVTSILTLQANGKLDLAINVEKNIDEVEKIGAVGMLLSLFISTACFVFAVLFYSFDLVHLDNYKLSITTISLLGLLIFFNAAFELLVAAQIKKNNVTLVSYSLLLKAIAVVAIQIGFGLFYDDPIFLVLSQLVGFVVVVCLLFFYNLPNLTSYFSIKALKEVISSKRSYILFSSPQSIISAAGHIAPVAIVGVMFGAAEAGLFWVANRLLAVPSQMLGKSTRNLYQQRLTSFFSNTPDKLFLEIGKATIGLSLLYLPTTFVLYFFGESLFTLVLGEGWGEASEYALWLSIAWMGCFFNIPSVSLVPIINKQKAFMIFESVSVTTRLVILVSAATFLSAIEAVKLYAIAFMIINVIIVFCALFSATQYKGNNEVL